MEWGTTAYELMWQLKELFDPEYVLNPGVILNSVRHSMYPHAWWLTRCRALLSYMLR
jgi:hypothetical protein